MRIKINDKIYRLEEIESGVDSLMELVEEPKYKDGDFVVDKRGDILIFRKKEGNLIYDHAYLQNGGILWIAPDKITTFTIERHATEEEKQKVLDALAKRGKRWNEEKRCVEDIPVRKFKKGDVVLIKECISSKVNCNIAPAVVDRYTDDNNYVVCEGIEYAFPEDWLEPYVEELKEGDLAIFWDDMKEQAFIHVFNKFTSHSDLLPYTDMSGLRWKNAIKFESKEQFERLVKGEI